MKTDLNALLAAYMPAFGRNRLDRFNLSAFGGLSRSSVFQPNATVDLSRVKGVEHPDYQGRSWIELLGAPPNVGSGALKRARSVLAEAQRNPDYYQSAIKKHGWSFYQRGQDIFISEGVHRTVIARFLLAANGLPTVVRGVGLTQLPS
jgi:hypothetical protein